MGIKLTTSIGEIDKELYEFEMKIHQDIIKVLSYVGEKCVTEARDRTQEESWFDQTGNLRSSIGYVIYHNGVEVKTSSFQEVKNGSDGPKYGKTLAEQIASEHLTGYVLIVVAGMHYADYVEAKDNKNVLASSYALANSLVPKMMKELEQKIYK